MRTAARQLDIIADTALGRADNGSHLSTVAAGGNGGHLSTASRAGNGSYLSTVAPDENGSHSSTEPPPENGSHSSTALKRLDARRRSLGISTSRLCAEAGIHPNTYRFAREGQAVSRPDTMLKLNRALGRLSAGEQADEPRTICLALIRLVTVQLARAIDADPALMLSQDFSEERVTDPTWRLASRLRRCAIYLLVEGLGLGKAKIGNALGITRQAVHKSVALIESEREADADFDATMRETMLHLTGGAR